MHFDALIFDLDGTLWDCSQASANAYNRVYETFEIGTRVTKEFVRSISGKPSSECDEIVLANVPTEMREKVSASLELFEIAAIQEAAPKALYPDVTRGLETLARSHKLFVVSNCSVRYLDIFHRHSGIGNLFADMECFGRTERLKHENIRALVERQKLASPCYIGDTAGDEDAAAKASLPFFHASYGFGEPVGSPVRFGSFPELVKYFMGLVRG